MGAEVVQITVGPELFYESLSLLEDTGFFNASLYSPFGIAGIETLGHEIALQCRAQFGRDPDMVVCTNAGRRHGYRHRPGPAEGGGRPYADRSRLN